MSSGLRYYEFSFGTCSEKPRVPKESNKFLISGLLAGGGYNKIKAMSPAVMIHCCWLSF